LKGNIINHLEEIQQEKDRGKAKDEKLILLDEERKQKLNAHEKLQESEHSRQNLNKILNDKVVEFENHRHEWNVTSKSKDETKIGLNQTINNQDAEISNLKIENSTLKKDNKMLLIRVDEWRAKFENNKDVEQVRDSMRRLANGH